MSIKSQISKSAEGYPLLGYCVYWSISELNIPYAEFIQKMAAAGLDTDYARPVQAKSALIKALRSETKGRKESFHRNILDDKTRSAFAIVGSNVNTTTIDVAFQTETKAIIDKETKQVTIEGYNQQALRDKFEAFKGTYTGDHFRRVTLDIIKTGCQGITIRERGGVYFVPSTHLEAFEKLQTLFSQFPGCSIDVIPVIDTAQAKKSMWKALTGEVEEDIKTLKEDLEKLDEASDRSVKIRLARYEVLKSKVENYEILLQGTAGALKSELDSLTNLLKRKMV
jgi:hypothetical protein